MAGSPIKTAAMAAGVAMGSSGIIILVSALFIGVVIVSLIPVYVPNTSIEGYGDVYVIPGYAVKAIYTNLTFVNFTNARVLNTAALSSICTMILNSRNIKNVYACVASNFIAYGPTNDTSGNVVSRRRRAPDDVAVYEVGDIYILFSNTCGTRRARFTPFSALTTSQNSSCVSQRLNACEAFRLTPNNGSYGNQWRPFPSGYSQVLYANGSNTTCASITISNLYYFSYALISNYINVRYTPILNASRIQGASNGFCQLYDIWPQALLKSTVDASVNPPAAPCVNVITG